MWINQEKETKMEMEKEMKGNLRKAENCCVDKKGKPTAWSEPNSTTPRNAKLKHKGGQA